MLGAPDRIRTYNLLIRSQVLYPLSYGRIVPTAECTARLRRASPTALAAISSLCDVREAELAATWDAVVESVSATQRRLMERIERDGLPAQWFEVLRLLLDAHDHRLPMSALARHLQMTAGGFTKLADRMARDDLIDRRNSSADRRVVYAALTTKGMRRAKEAAGLYQDALRQHLRDALTPQVLAGLAAAAQALRDVHGDALAGDQGDHILIERDPALPERRGRGRPSR
jgi:DNA-binding MarR family transcriptional regulator